MYTRYLFNGFGNEEWQNLKHEIHCSLMKLQEMNETTVSPCYTFTSCQVLLCITSSCKWFEIGRFIYVHSYQIFHLKV